MTCSSIDWGKLLSPDSSIRPDVTFLVSNDVNLRDKIRGLESENSGEVTEITAHRLLLGAASPVFEREFFGSEWNKEESVRVKGSTIEAFSTLMDILYEKNRDKENDTWGLENKSFYTLFEVLHLADRYDMKKVVGIITKEISEMEITRENVMEAAAVAEHYKLFPEASKGLFQRCAVTMDNILKTKADILKFLADDTEDEVDNLLFKRILVAMHESRCSSCDKPRDECLDGRDVTAENAVSGRLVYNNPGGTLALGYRNLFTDQSPGELVQLHSNNQYGYVWTIRKPEGGSYPGSVYVVYNGVSQFVFKCK